LHEENWEFGHVAAETGRKTDTDDKITRKLVYHMEKEIKENPQKVATETNPWRTWG